jgi:hypothetical protein
MALLHITGEHEADTSSVGSFLANLPEYLGAMIRDPRCLVAIASFSDERYVQFWVEPDGHVFAEVISNLNIGTAVALSSDDEEKLRAMGWLEPEQGTHPNWLLECEGLDDLLPVVMKTAAVITKVLGESLTNQVRVRSFEMPPRHRSLNDERSHARVYRRRDDDVASSDDFDAFYDYLRDQE